MDQSPAHPAPHSTPTGFAAFRIILVFACGYFLSYVLRSVNAAIAPLLAQDLNLSPGELGWLTSAYFLAFSAVQIPVGIWLDRHGARRTESLLLLVAAFGAALMATSESLWLLSVGRMLIGVGVSACLMAAYSYFRRCFPAEQQPRLVMYMLIAGTSGALVATQPALTLAEWIGWRHSFGLIAVLLVLSALAIFLFAGDLDRQHAPTVTAHPGEGSFLTLCKHPLMIQAIPPTIFIVGGFGALQTLWAGPWFTGVLGMTADQAGQTLLYLNAMILVAYILMGTISPWLIKRGVALLTQSLCALIWIPLCFAVIVFWQGQSSWIVWLILSLMVPAMFLLQTQIALAFPKHIAGRILTTYNLMVFVGSFAVQWGFGLLTDMFIAFGYASAQALTGAMGCLVILQFLSLFWFLARKPDGSIRT
ncbi:MFS transporter [Zwartia vadi]|uniref:MFS transporter n=1 Tax=Zwartia vadi TaxID=3058168 RepID=UPI0025B61CF1|nr:MFS transporter [Zwartia vadi]MDN3986019.1 MFS transporter [Zwartia vadi]